MKASTHHVFHIGCWGKHLPSDFVVVIEDGEHVVLTNVTLPPAFGDGPGVGSVAARCTEMGEVGVWRGRGGKARCQCTCSARYAQE